MTPLTLPSLVGATASAKSTLAVELARRVPLEILGADSRQIYRGFDLGTAKPSPAEREVCPHHLVDFLDPAQTYSAATFGEEARRIASEVWKRGRIPLLVGGSGLYLRAAESGLFSGPKASPEIRERLQRKASARGSESLHAELAHIDPAAAGRIAPADLVRIVRALEVYEITGETLSAHHEAHRKAEPLAVAVRWGVQWEASHHRERITARIHAMFAAGWEEEVRNLLASGVPEAAPAWKSLGYEAVCRLVGQETSREEAVAEVIRETRAYAKRQRTWFRAVPNVEWVSLGKMADIPLAADRIARRLLEILERGNA